LKFSELRNIEARQADEVHRLQNSLSQCKRDVIERQPLVEVIPASAFRTTLFDPSVVSELDRIASASDLSTGSKIQGIYRCLHKYCSEKLRNFEAYRSTAQKLEKAIRNFLSSISFSRISFEDFVAGDALSQIPELRNGHDDLRRKNDIFNSIVKHFHECFGLEATSEPSVILSQMNQVSSERSKDRLSLAKRKKQVLQLRRSLAAAESKIESTMTNSEQAVVNLRAENDQLRQKIHDLERGLQKQRREIHTLKEELNEAATLQETTESNHQTRYQEFLSERTKIENDLRDDIQRAACRYNDMLLEIEGKEEMITNLKRKIRSQKAAIADRDLQMQRVQEEAAQILSSQTEKLQTEKATMKDDYDRSLAEMQSLCDKQRTDFQHIQAQLVKSEKFTKQLQHKIANKRQTIDGLKQDLAIKTEQLEREKRLSDASARTKILAAESSFAQQLDELKGKFECEKRRLMSFAADHFRLFLNIEEGIDEEAFKRMILKVKDQITRLETSDMVVRRLVGADQGQRTEDAVVQALNS
jgi:DNA repair exonuclease SbcCD ATPase subunit